MFQGGLPAQRRCDRPEPRLLPAGALYAEWEQLGRQLLSVANSSAWWVGDWLLFGQRVYADRYERAIVRTGFDYQTLRNYAWVAASIEPPRRQDALSHSHHAEVASLEPEDQDAWLRRALVNGWSRNRLRAELRQDRGRVGEAPARSAIKLEFRRSAALCGRRRQRRAVATSTNGSRRTSISPRRLRSASSRTRSPPRAGQPPRTGPVGEPTAPRRSRRSRSSIPGGRAP